MKIIKRIINILTCLFGAWYLMKLVDEITLSTYLQKMMILLYFIVVLSCITFAYYKKTKRTDDSRNIYLSIKVISVSIVFFTLLLFGDNILPREYTTNNILIKAVNEKNEMSQGYECWITKIEVDGVTQDLSKLSVNDDWTFNEESNSLVANAIDYEKIINLNFKSAKSITIAFVKHGWSGKVDIDSQTFNETIDLYDAEGDQQICKIYGATKQLNRVNEISLFTGYLLLMSSLLTIFLIWIRNKVVYSIS